MEKKRIYTMNESEVMKCPKCGGEMVEANRLVAHTRVLASVSLAKKGDILGDRIVPHYCESCGYIEFYKEIKGRKKTRDNAFFKKCVKCGKQIPIASEECSYCGAKQ
jgi:predicted nucleic-acid-binding Zn-ribbon protein